MQSGDAKPANGKSRDSYVILAGEALDRIVVPLTVVHGHVQLSRRRVQRDQATGNEDLERALGQMEDATRTIVAEMSGIIGATSR